MKTWLTEKLKIRVKEVFEPRYNRTLSNSEIEEIASNLASFIENVTKFTLENSYAKQN